MKFSNLVHSTKKQMRINIKRQMTSTMRSVTTVPKEVSTGVSSNFSKLKQRDTSPPRGNGQVDQIANHQGKKTAGKFYLISSRHQQHLPTLGTQHITDHQRGSHQQQVALTCFFPHIPQELPLVAALAQGYSRAAITKAVLRSAQS